MPDSWDVGQMLIPTMTYRRLLLCPHRTVHMHIPTFCPLTNHIADTRGYESQLGGSGVQIPV